MDFNDYESCYIFSVQFQKDAILALGIENTHSDSNYDASIFRLKAPSIAKYSEWTEIYPNPFNNQITIKSSLFFNKIEIYNMLGQPVFSNRFHKVKNYKIDTEYFKTGVYHLVIYQNNQVIDDKTMIKD